MYIYIYKDIFSSPTPNTPTTKLPRNPTLNTQHEILPIFRFFVPPVFFVSSPKVEPPLDTTEKFVNEVEAVVHDDDDDDDDDDEDEEDSNIRCFSPRISLGR